MALEQKSIVEMIEVPTNGSGVYVRIALKILKDGVEISSKWHRTSIPTEISPAEQLAYVNQHLLEMGEAQLSNSDIQRVGLFHKLAGDMPSDYAPLKTVDAIVEEIKGAKASTKVDAS